MHRFLVVSTLAFAVASAASAPAQRPVRVYISVDMEGIAGVVTAEWMTNEAVAAVNGAKDAGATDIVVSDSHGNGENLLIDRFPADVRIVRSWPRPLMMTPQAAEDLVRRTVKAGVARRASLKPYVVKAPVRLDVTFKNYTPAEMLTFLPSVQRNGSHGIRFTGRDIVEVSRFLEFINTYQPGMTP